MAANQGKLTKIMFFNFMRVMMKALIPTFELDTFLTSFKLY